MTSPEAKGEPEVNHCDEHGYSWRGEGLHGMGCPRCVTIPEVPSAEPVSPELLDAAVALRWFFQMVKAGGPDGSDCDDALTMSAERAVAIVDRFSGETGGDGGQL